MNALRETIAFLAITGFVLGVLLFMAGMVGS